VSDVTTQTADDVATTAPPKPWYKQPKVIVGLVLVVVVFLILREFGTRRLRFSSDVTGEGAFDLAFFWSLVPQMLQALAVTTLATIQGFIVAAVLGLFLALGRRSSVKLISWPVTAFIEFIRSTPLLVQLFIIYFGLPQMGIELGPFVAGVLGLGLNVGAYNAETIRGGIISVPVGQTEAARSLGMSSALAMRRIILPQALRIIVPPLGNNFIILIKDTSLVSTITLVELTLTAQRFIGSTYKPFEMYLMAAVLYAVLTTTASLLLGRLEKRTNRGYRR
jgi:polar amino acid transport system permease protein